MGTAVSEVINLALVSIQDYKIDKLYDADFTQPWDNYLCGFLDKAILDFYDCKKPLTYNHTSLIFDYDLSSQEIYILSQWIIYEWFVREVNNVEQFNLSLNDTDFKRHSEAQNLQQKSEYRDKTREMVMQSMVDYELKNVNWKDWANGNFGI